MPAGPDLQAGASPDLTILGSTTRSSEVLYAKKNTGEQA